MGIFRYWLISFIFYVGYIIGLAVLHGMPKELPTLTAWQVGAIACICLSWRKDTNNA